MSVEKHIDLFEKVKARVGSDEIAAVILDQIGKDDRVLAMRESGMTPRRDDVRIVNGEPATEKQIAYLKRLGVDFKDDITRQEASDLIDKAKA